VAALMGLEKLPERCKVHPPQPWRLGHRPIPMGLRDWITKNMIRETEQLLDYPFPIPAVGMV
jgi:hypothetical protein